MPIKLNSTGGGSVTIDVPSMSTANTLTLPAITGNVITSSDSNTVTQTMINRSSFYGGFGPSFSAYLGTTQAITANTWTKIQFGVEEWDTANCFDSTTNYRFTPNVAGYYQFNLTCSSFSSTYSGGNYVGLYRNNTQIRWQFLSTYGSPGLSSMLYMNGSTDYIEGFIYLGTSQNLTASYYNNLFQGFLARPA